MVGVNNYKYFYYMFIFIFLLVLKYVNAVYLGSYALEIITPSEESKKRLAFEYDVECLGGYANVTFFVYERGKPSRGVDAKVSLFLNGSLYESFYTDGGRYTLLLENGVYDIYIRGSSKYLSLDESEAVVVDCPSILSVNVTNETNESSNLTYNATDLDKEKTNIDKEKVDSVSDTSSFVDSVKSEPFCSVSSKSLFVEKGQTMVFFVEKEGEPYSGRAFILTPDGKVEVYVKDGVVEYMPDKEGYYSLDVPGCVEVSLDYVLLYGGKEELFVKGLEVYKGCKLVLYGEKPYEGYVEGEERFEIPKTIGRFELILKDGRYDVFVKGKASAQLYCPKTRFLLDKDLFYITASIAVVLFLLYLLYLLGDLDVVVDGRKLKVVRKISQEGVGNIRVSLVRDGKVVWEDVTDDKGEIEVPSYLSGSYDVFVANKRKKTVLFD